MHLQILELGPNDLSFYQCAKILSNSFSRPEFAANAPYLEKNPITGIKVCNLQSPINYHIHFQ